VSLTVWAAQGRPAAEKALTLNGAEFGGRKLRVARVEQPTRPQQRTSTPAALAGRKRSAAAAAAPADGSADEAVRARLQWRPAHTR
jgi:hypothetical protein